MEFAAAGKEGVMANIFLYGGISNRFICKGVKGLSMVAFAVKEIVFSTSLQLGFTC